MEDKAYDQEVTDWLPQPTDKKMLLDILQNESKWIVPRTGARDPLETIGEVRKSAINI